MRLKLTATPVLMSTNQSLIILHLLVQVQALLRLIAMIPVATGDAGEGQDHDQLAVKTQDADASLSPPMTTIPQNVPLLADQTEGDLNQEMIEDTTEMKDRLKDSKAIIEGADLVSPIMTDMRTKR
jgi:hypothetical protein